MGQRRDVGGFPKPTWCAAANFWAAHGARSEWDVPG